MKRIMYEVSAKDAARFIINWYNRFSRTTTDLTICKKKRIHLLKDKEIQMQRPFELIMMLNVAILHCIYDTQFSMR